MVIFVKKIKLIACDLDGTLLNSKKEITKGDTQIPHIEKEAFDKDSLVLLHTQKSAPHIVLDMNSLNAVKTYPLPDDLANEILKDKQVELNQRRHKPNNRNRNNR